MRMSRRMGVYAQLRDKLKYAGSISIDSAYRYNSGLASVGFSGNHVILAGGYGNNTLYSDAYACDASGTTVVVDSLQEAKYAIGATNGNEYNYAFFISGYVASTATAVTTADAYNSSLTHTLLPALQNVYGGNCAVAMVNNSVVIAGRLKYAEYYTSTFTLTSLGMPFGVDMSSCSAAWAGIGAIFKNNKKAYAFNKGLTVTEITTTDRHESGKPGVWFSTYLVFCDSSSSYNCVTKYSTSDFSKTVAASISPVRYKTLLGNAANSLLIAGGYTASNEYSNKIDVYDRSFTAQKAKTLPACIYNGRTARLGNQYSLGYSHAVFGGFEVPSTEQSNGTVLHLLKEIV